MTQAVAKPESQGDAWESAVSAWADGQEEIRAEDLDTPYGRQVWDTYHLIGDVLRSEELAFRPTDLFYARVSRAVDAEPAIVAAPRKHFSRARLGLSGMAVAAAVATVAWVALPHLSGETPEGVSAPVMASSEEPGSSYSYVEAHRQFAGSSPIRQVSLDVGVSP